MIDHFYDHTTGLFWFQKDYQRINVLTPFSLYPLWTARLRTEMKARLEDHLTDPSKFRTTYPLPTVATCDPTYKPSQMWRGPVWINVNYIFVEALNRTGYVPLARELAERTLCLVMAQRDIHEYESDNVTVVLGKRHNDFWKTSHEFLEFARGPRGDSSRDHPAPWRSRAARSG